MPRDFYFPDYRAYFPEGVRAEKPELDAQGRPTTLLGIPVAYTEAVKPGVIRLADSVRPRRDKGR